MASREPDSGHHPQRIGDDGWPLGSSDAEGLRIPCCLVEDECGEVALYEGRNRLDALELIALWL